MRLGPGHRRETPSRQHEEGVLAGIEEKQALADFDVQWRNSFVRGWNPLRQGEFVLSDTPGLGLELDENALANHPYVPNAFPSLWDGNWMTDFTQTNRTAE